MALTPGTRLGVYEILAPLGAGGMGEVYRARDTRLDRTVAIKVLPASLASDPQFRERFEREARAISALDHPHICALYDVGEEQGTSFLVMQFLEGETLADRLAREGGPTRPPLPLEHALTIAIQIADALVEAHRAGIIHRDLKPGNIFLVRRGGPSGPPEAKLLDFGLAKTNAPVVAVGGSMVPTTPPVDGAQGRPFDGAQGRPFDGAQGRPFDGAQGRPFDGAQGRPNLTAQGAILGTFQYMAPEQIEGFEADARTDIFAFGAVLFEMLTGRKAFEGKTRASLLGAILKDEPPPVSQVQTLAPASLNRIVATCLAKDPDDRWQTARDLLRELKWVADGTAVASTAVARTARG
jgi:serine/threonine protein kinase